MAKAALELQAGESVIKEGAISLLLGRLQAKPGTAYITNQRIVLFSQNNMGAMFGLLGMLIQSLFFKPKREIDIPLTGITKVTQGKYGLSETLELETSVGSYKLGVKKNEWRDALQQALQTQGRSMVPIADKEWLVQ